MSQPQTRHNLTAGERQLVGASLERLREFSRQAGDERTRLQEFLTIGLAARGLSAEEYQFNSDLLAFEPILADEEEVEAEPTAVLENTEPLPAPVSLLQATNGNLPVVEEPRAVRRSRESES